MNKNPLVRVKDLGQSVWLDYIRRDMLTPGGQLQQLIEEDGLRGVTSNPAIFEKAIGESDVYDEAIRTLAQQGKNTAAIYERLTVEDVGRGADLFRPVHEQTKGGDGFVSLEVSPRLARDTEGTLNEARRLWAALDRPNVLIKVPATLEGLPAIRQLISEGINVNVTLLFGIPRYEKVAEAYISGLEARVAAGKPVDRVASVASFFLSRIDTLLDPKLDELIKAGGPKAAIAELTHGQIAIASARIAYQESKQIYGTERWKKLAAKGARIQRLLWASTSTKNPKYSDVKYVEALIGPDTVNTMPMETVEAYRDHGQPAARLETELPKMKQILQQLPEIGIDLAAATQQLEDEGVKKFVQPYDKLLDALEAKRKAVIG